MVATLRSAPSWLRVIVTAYLDLGGLMVGHVTLDRFVRVTSSGGWLDQAFPDQG